MSNLDKLMQMATLEQLNNMVQQLSKANATNVNATNVNATNITNVNEPKDVLSLPIVQKVIAAYEEEIKTVKAASNSCKCRDYTEAFDRLLYCVDRYNSNLQRIESKLDDLTTMHEKHLYDHSFNRSRNSVVEDKNQRKLTSFYGLKEVVLEPEIVVEQEVVLEPEQEVVLEEDVVLEEEVVLEEDVVLEEEVVLEEDVLEPEIVVEKQNITLQIEEVDKELDELEEDPVEEEVVEEDPVEEEVVEEEVVEEEPIVEEEEPTVKEEPVKEEAVVEEEEEDDVSTEEEVATEEEEDEEVDENEVEEEEDEEVFEIEIDDVTYFATDEENGILYEVDKDGEVGKKVGIIKDGEPIFS